MERLQNCLNAEFIADASIPDGTKLMGGQKVSDPFMFNGDDSNARKKESRILLIYVTLFHSHWTSTN